MISAVNRPDKLTISTARHSFEPYSETGKSIVAIVAKVVVNQEYSP